MHFIALLIALFFLHGSACLASSSYPGNAVRVNGVDISYQRYIGVYQELERSKGISIGARGDQLGILTRLRKEAMDILIEQELVRQEAEKQGVEVTDAEVHAAYDELRKPFDDDRAFALRLETEGFTVENYRVFLRHMLRAKKYLDGIRSRVANVSDEELESYYHRNERRLTLPEQVRVRHILLSWKPLGKPDDRVALREMLEEIRQNALAGEDFADLAREYSEDSTRVNGGDVGFFHRGEMVPAFEAMAFSLQPGEISDIIETPFGVHFLKLEERKPERLLPLGQVRDQLREYIAEEKMEDAVKAEKEKLRERSKVEVLIPIERPHSN